MKWISVKERLPQVERGALCEFIIACRRADSGRVGVFSADYLNEYVLSSEDDDEKPFTGWYTERGSRYTDYDSCFSEVCQHYSNGTSDEVTHWMPLPPPPGGG